MIIFSAIHTAAIEMLTGPDSSKWSRKPEIVADAAYAIISQDPKSITGQFCIDEDVLKKAGIANMDEYACHPGQKTFLDLDELGLIYLISYHETLQSIKLLFVVSFTENKDKLMLDFFLDSPDSEANEKILDASAAASSAGASASAGGGKVGALFDKIQSSMNEELVSKTQALYQFSLTGAEAGKWFVDLRTGTGKCGPGECGDKVDATLTMDSKNFFDMFAGKLKPSTAYMMGKLKISGNLQKAMKLEKLMGKLKAKL